MRNQLIVVAALVAACTGSSNYWIAYTPAHGSLPASKADVVQAAVVGLTDAGKEVDQQDAATGLVLSKWFSGDGFGGDQSRFRIRVTVSDSAYDVIATCEGKSAMTGAWQPCEEKGKVPRFVVDAMASVEKSIRAAHSSGGSAAVVTPPAAPRGFYCSSGTCARDKGACEQARIAANDATPCGLVEAAHCFALGAGGESCAPTAEACTQRHETAGPAASGECAQRN